MRPTTPIFILTLLLSWSSLFADSTQKTVSRLRTGFVEIGRLCIAWSQAMPEERKKIPSYYQAELHLLDVPAAILEEAIDRGIRQGQIEERVGALCVYNLASQPPAQRIARRADYQNLFIEMLQQDDQKVGAYTAVLLTNLRTYPAPETVRAIVDQIPRATNPHVREGLIDSAATLVQMEIPIYQQTTPVEKERVLSDLETYLMQNRDHIRVGEHGQLYIAADKNAPERILLTAEDRSRVRKDPACVLRLLHEMLEGGSGSLELSARCGEALLGQDGARLFAQAARQVNEGEVTTLDFQTAMASSRGKYPSMDAVLLAIAYVAAYQTDPEIRKLAQESLEDFGNSDDLRRVLKGEPRDVKKKAMALADEIFEGENDRER
jgi:hypothetical protein